MQRAILRMLFIVLGCQLICLGNSVYADFDLCCSEGDYYLVAELLYWKSMNCPIFVARRSINNITPAPRDELYLRGEYDPGVRIRFGYQTCHWFSDVSYLYFCSTDKEEEGVDGFSRMNIAGAPPFGDGSIQLAKSRARFRYQNVDGRVGYHLFQRECLDTYLYGNARWVKIDLKNLTQGMLEDETTFTDFLKQDSRFNGGGLGLGFGVYYLVCNKLGLEANAGIMGIIGETSLEHYRSNSIETNVTEVFLTRSQNWCHILPAFDFKIGASYLFRWHCLKAEVKIGYELDYYFNTLRYASSNIISTPGSARLPFFAYTSSVFGGPFFNLSFIF